MTLPMIICLIMSIATITNFGIVIKNETKLKELRKTNEELKTAFGKVGNLT